MLQACKYDVVANSICYSNLLEGDTCCIGFFFMALPMERLSWRRCGGNGYSTDGLVVISTADLHFAVWSCWNGFD